MNDYSRKVEMYCPTCGNNQFWRDTEAVDEAGVMLDGTEMKCGSCNRVFTKEELIEANAGVINANAEEVKQELLQYAEKELMKVFKDIRL